VTFDNYFSPSLFSDELDIVGSVTALSCHRKYESQSDEQSSEENVYLNALLSFNNDNTFQGIINLICNGSQYVLFEIQL
jgi:hypothetical protein